MTKRLLHLLILLGLALVIYSCSTLGSTLVFTENDVENSPNLIVNNGFGVFSTIPSEALKGWNVHLETPDSQESPVVIDGKEMLEGKSSLRIDASNKAVLILSDPFVVRRYGGYYLRSYFKTDSPTPPKVQLRFIVFKENGKIVNRFKQKFLPKSEWNRSTISAGFIRPGARFGRLGIFIPPFKEGSVWIDNTGCFEVHGFKID